MEEAGYFTGSTRKGWGPGDYEVAGLTHNPAGKTFSDYHELVYHPSSSGRMNRLMH